MAYTVLARRYRSGTFDEVIGQDHVAQTLKRAIEASRIAHAYLFTGTRGVGKTSMARIMAKALNCSSAKSATTTPCNKCDSCQSIARGEDIDVIEIDAASNTGVDNVRDIIENAAFRPARSRFKIYIIDEVHMLSKAAFNALLKIMEEPPEHVKFILATTEAEKILPTILSRCQRFDFRNIPTREIVGHLRAICRRENVDASDDALLLVARAGAGSMRDSLSLLDRLLSVGEKKLTTELIEQLLGMPRSAQLFDLAEAIGDGDAKRSIEVATSMIVNGLATDTLVTSLIEHFHNLLLLATCGKESQLVEIAGMDLNQVEAQAKKFGSVNLVQNIAILEDLRRQLRGSQVGRALVDACLARMALAAQFVRIDELVAKLNGIPLAADAEKKKPTCDVAVNGSGANPADSAFRREAPLVVETFTPVVHRELPVEPASQLLNPASDDELPAVGKVAPAGAVRSIFATFNQKPIAKPVALEVAPAPIMGGDHQRMWEQVVGHFHGLNASGTAALLESGRLTSVEDDVVKLRYEGESATSGRLLNKPEKREAVQAQFARVIGRAVRLEIEIIEPVLDKLGKEPEVAREPRVHKPALEEVLADEPLQHTKVDMTAIEAHPIIQQLKAKLEAKVVHVE